MLKYIGTLISLALLIYGLIRVGGGSVLLGQEIGLLNFETFHKPIKDIGIFIAKSTDKQIIPVSVVGYVSYSTLMGLVLSIGATGALKNQSFGLPFIGTFLAMYALMFVNFQIINRKAIDLAICTILFGILLWLESAERNAA